jgi:hypothetical protein
MIMAVNPNVDFRGEPMPRTAYGKMKRRDPREKYWAEFKSGKACNF